MILYLLLLESNNGNSCEGRAFSNQNACDGVNVGYQITVTGPENCDTSGEQCDYRAICDCQSMLK